MNKILATIISVLIIGGIGWLVISYRNVPEESKRQIQSLPDRQTGKRAPDFHLQDYNGNIVQLADFAGKPLIINSWAAWCSFCRQELVDFASAQKEFSAEGGDVSDRGKVIIVAINRAESLKVAKKYSDELGVTDELIFLLDPSDSFYQSIGGFSMPETIFVDKDGNMTDHKRGSMNINEMRTKIKKLLSL